MLGGAYGFSLSAAPVSDAGSGGGSTGNISWGMETQTSTVVTSPPVTYISLPLTYTPVSPQSIWVWFDGMMLNPEDWVYEDIGNGPTIRPLFALDPAQSPNGVNNVFYIQYAYSL